MRFRLGLMAALGLGLSILPAFAAGVIALDAVRAGLADGSVVVVDVREPDEFVAGHVPGAINLPLSRFDPAALPKPEGKTVVVMCRSGRRSGQAQAIAAAAGRGDVVDYAGSMNEWLAKGQPIVTGR
jgi:rhodanese-related sulfurtransferase